MFPHLQFSPLRVPDWRWRLAEGSQQDEDPFSYCDVWVDRARDLMNLKLSGSDDRRVEALSGEMRDLFLAWTCWVRADLPYRWALEARILARETDREIAAKMGCPEGMVAAYENVFFNVRDRLDQHHYILFSVLGPPPVHERDYGAIWRHFAYRGGPHVLDACLSHFADTPTSGSTSGSDRLQEMALAGVQYRAAVAALMLQVTPKNSRKILNTFRNLVRAERKRTGRSKPRRRKPERDVRRCEKGAGETDPAADTGPGESA